MAHRSQCSSAGDNPLDPNYLPPHYREEYRLAIDALVEEDLEGYYQFLQKADVVDFLSPHEIQYIQESVQIPQQIRHSEQNFLETVGDGSSDTYWPIHSDLDAPGLDLGWPDLHAFIGPTEVTTLVNPPEPEMPSIKEQARRLIKNAQQVIAIAMDMFTDVDIFHDIVHAAMRNVAVYILLDELNVQHFINMVNNCRVNLQSIQLIRVRTVNGITYHCRSGKSFKGQMMNRFLLTDCRAVLSGNYSFMWSFEKLHRSMAHLFLGQLVSTFDEEFRILYAQSQPLLIEDMFAPMKEFNILEKRKYPSERTSLLSESRKFLSLDTPHPDELPRHSYDEHVDMDWRMMAIKKKEPLHGSADMYGRFPSPKQRMDPSFDQGPPRMPMMDNPSLKRYSYAEGVQSRHTYPFMPQQGMPEADNQGRQFHRQQQPYPGPGREPDYSPYDKFWNQDYLIADPYPEPGLPQEVEPPDNFDPVFSYLSSTRNLDFDQSSDKLPAAPDLPLSSSFPRRLSLGQPYACQTSPTPSNASEQKQFFQEPNPDRKDPIVKRGLRDWRISSYLSAYDSRGDEGPPLAPLNMPDPNEPSNPIQQPTPEVSVSKIPNVREFRIPAIPRASQMPIYAKILPREQPKNMFEEPITVATPSPSESSSTTEGEKTEEMEQKEPKPSVFQREDSFRRKFNPGVLRSSRLRSSLIFSSLDQQQDARTNPGQQEEDSDKNEAEQTKPSFVSQVLGQRRSTPREPFEWSRFIKQAADTPAEDASKPDDGSIKADDKDAAKDENSRDSSGKREVLESSKQPDVEQTNSSSSVLQSKPTESEPTQTDQPMKQPKPLPTSSMYLDMSDPDARLMFFKELAAKRKAAKAAEAEKGKVKEQMKTPTEEKNNTAVKKEQAGPQETAASMSDSKTSVGLLEKNTTAEKEKTVPAETCKTVSLSSGTSEKNYQDSHGESDPNSNQSSKEAQTRISTDKELNIEMKTSQPAASVPVSGKGEAPRSKLLGEPKLSEPKLLEPAAEIIPPSIMDATPANAPAPAQGTDEAGTPCIGSTSNESSLLAPTSVEVPPCSSAALESKAPNLEASISHPPLPSEQHTGSEPSSSNSVLTPPSDHILPDSSSKTSPGSSPSISSPFPTKADLISSDVTTEHPSPNQQETSALSTQSSSSATLDFNTKNPESVQSARGISCPPLPPEQDTGSKPNSSNPTVQIHPSDPPVSGSPIRPGSSPSTSSPPSTKAGTVSSDFSPEDSSSNQLPPNQQESVTASTPSSKEALEQTKAEDESNQGHIDSVSQLTSSETVSGVVPAHVESDISPDKCAAAASEPITSSTQSTAKTDLEATCGPTHSEDPKSERATGEESEVLESSGRGRADDSSPESCLHNAVDPERISRTDQNEITVSTFSAADFPSEHSPAETNCLFHPEVTTPASGLETITSPKDPPVTPSSVGIESCSPLTESAGSVLTQRLSASQSPSDTQLPQEQVTDSNTPPDLPLTEICSPKEPTSTALTEPESVTPERVPPEPPAPAEDSTMVRQNKENQEIEVSDPGEKIDEDTQATLEVDKTKESASSEKINDQIKQGNCSDPPEITSDEVIPTSPLTKQPKSSQCRYHSSTANVLSSSNLRDDTKLLLEQISANSQSRNDATKEAPVTDDEKEDEADKNAQREKERGMRYLSKVPEKSNQERDKLLERIQSMRKERKVYSRFEKSTSFSRREKASLISAKPASVERELLPPPRHNSTPDGALTRI